MVVELSVTLAVKEYVPAVAGVPWITPVLPRLRPPGKVPPLTLQVYGVLPPVAVSVAEYAVPTVPAVKLEVVICNGKTTSVVVVDDVVVCWVVVGVVLVCITVTVVVIGLQPDIIKIIMVKIPTA